MMKVWGTESERAYIYVHGMNGSKDDAEGFAGTAERFGYQVVSFDVRSFDPVNTLPELEGVYSFAAERWENVSLYAVSIGVWYSMVCFRGRSFAQTLLVSPVVSPERDNIPPRHEIEGFAKKFACELSVLPDAEHWIHTSSELEFLRQWEESALTQQLC